jgi:inward rectifier potassium channel
VNPANWIRHRRYPNHLLLAVPWPLFFGLVASGYLLLSLLVAGLYVLDPQGIARVDGSTTSFADAFSSASTPWARSARGHCFLQAFTAICSSSPSPSGVVRDRDRGLLFSRFSRSTARILFSQEATLHTYNGLPTLMSRLANERRKAIDERSAEGQRICRLLRDHFAAPIIVDVYPPRACRRLCRHLFTGAGFHSA